MCSIKHNSRCSLRLYALTSRAWHLRASGTPLQALFGLAKLLQPSILFFDEIDALLGSRGGATEHESSRKVRKATYSPWPLSEFAQIRA